MLMRWLQSLASEVEYSIFMQALAERDPGTHLDGVTAQREHPTMRWIASHSIYLEWLASSAPAFLHLHGKPGSGSSAVAGVIMEEVAAIPDFQDATFVRFNSHKQYIQTSETARILLSLCRQILSANPKLFRRTKPLCRTMRADNLFNKSAAWGLFQSLLNFHSGPLFICLDGIHNLPPDFLEYLSTIKSLKQESGEPPRFLVTSSSETLPIFPDSLKSTIATLSLSDEADMKRATKQAVQRRVLDVAWRNVLWYDLQKTIIKTVCHDLPPYLVAMQSLDLLDVSTPHSTEAAFYFKLEHLPRTLDGLYSHYIAILSRWERQVLGCIVTAVQPLRSVELAICLSLQGEETQSWRDLRSRTSQDIIKDILGHKKIRHLVKVRDDRVYPIYETLTDYLHTKHKQVSKQLHLSMLKACIKYISDLYHDTSFLLGLTSTPELGSNITQDATLSKEAGFLRYASLCWPDHYNLCHGDPQAYRTVSQLFGNPALRSTWFSLYAHFKSHLPENLESLTSPLAMANKLGLTLIVDDMIRGAIPGGDHSKTTWSNPLADSSISSRMPWADTLEVKHQLVQEVITFAVEEGRAELIFQLTSVLSPDTLEIKGHKGLTPLLSATRNGHMDVVNALVKQGASSKATGRDGSTILHLATRLGSLSIVKRILEINSQLDIGAMNNEGYDAIKIAAESGFTTILEELLHRIDPETRKKLVNTPLPSSSQTPLFLAARHGHSEVVKLLLKHKADPGIHNDGESSALYQAAKEGDSDVFTALLTHPMYQKLSIHPQVIGPFNDADGESSIASDDLDACLLVAARYGRVPILKKLLEYKVRVNVTGEGKNTALHLAAREGFEQATTLLLKQHCEVDLRNEERLTPIQLAAQNGHIGVVRTLHKEGKANIARGPDPEPPLPFRSALSTLEMAAMEGQVPVVEYLLVMDPASAPRALQLAAENGQTAVVRYLMANQDQISVSVAWDDAAWIEAAGAALKKRHLEVLRELLTFKLSGVGETGLPAISQEFYHLLYMAIEKNYGPEVQVLAEKGFDMNKPNVKNEHPLHLAVKWNSPNVIVPLVKGGSSLGHIDDTQKDTPLYRAVSRNHAEQVVHELLEAGADPNWKNLGQEDRTPLHQACSVNKDNSLIITCLLDHQADALARDDDGWTPLHYTTDKFSLPNAIALVGINRERTHLIEIRNNYQSTPLVLAAENGAVDVMEFFLECGADPMLTNKTGSSALHRAAGGAHLDAVKLLIENRFKTADPTMSKANGITALHMAIHNSVPQLEMVEYLLSRDGVDINAQSSNFGSPLCAAARFYSTGYFTPKGDGLKLCKLLMERGADVNSTGGWMYSPLHIAAEHGSAELVKLLLSKDDTNVDIFWEEHGTPLSVAILHEHETVVGILLQRGADLNIPLDGETAVQLAVRTGDSGVVETLLEKRLEKFQVVQGLEDALWAAVRKDMPQAVKALLAERSKDPSSTPDTIIQGWTILTYAIYWDSDDVIGYLLDNPEQHDANIDHHNDAGNAPLHMAIEKGADELLGQLLDHKAEPNICDRVGRTPLMLSAKKADLDVMDMLISKGGNVFSKDLRLRDALYWACLSQSSDAVTKIVAVMQNKGSEWLTSCSAAIFPVLHASEARQNLLEALFKGEDMTARKEVLAGIAVDRNNWTLAYTLKHSHTPSVTSDTDFLPGWFVEYAQEAADKSKLLQPRVFVELTGEQNIAKTLLLRLSQTLHPGGTMLMQRTLLRCPRMGRPSRLAQNHS